MPWQAPSPNAIWPYATMGLYEEMLETADPCSGSLCRLRRAPFQLPRCRRGYAGICQVSPDLWTEESGEADPSEAARKDFSGSQGHGPSPRPVFAQDDGPQKTE